MKFQSILMALVLATLATANSAAFGADRSQGKASMPRGKIVALAYDAGSNSIVKAYSHALYRSRNEGRDWELITLPKAAKRGSVNAVSVSAHDGRTLYVAGTGVGVLRSTDGGKTWIGRNAGLPTKDIVALSSHADQAQTVYVYATGHGVFRSEDAGDHWRLMDAGPRDKVVQFVHSNMPGSMKTGWFFAATAKGVSRSMDCFCGWRDAGALGHAVTTVTYDPQQTREIYAATADGLFVSVDGGEQWSRAQSPGKVSALVVIRGGVLYAAADNALFRTADHGATWQPVDA